MTVWLFLFVLSAQTNPVCRKNISLVTGALKGKYCLGISLRYLFFFFFLSFSFCVGWRTENDHPDVKRRDGEAGDHWTHILERQEQLAMGIRLQDSLFNWEEVERYSFSCPRDNEDLKEICTLRNCRLLCLVFILAGTSSISLVSNHLPTIPIFFPFKSFL